MNDVSPADLRAAAKAFERRTSQESRNARYLLLDAADTIESLTPPKPQPAGETVRVRVAVSLNRRGEWIAAGCHDIVPENVRAAVTNFWEFEGDETHVITADLPLPRPIEITATVEQPE